MQRKVQIHRKNLNLFALFIIPCHCSTLICTHFLFFFHQKLFMSCLPIRLPPPKKAWKSFTSKLRTKLHRLHRAKSIRKRRFQLNPSPPWLPFRPPKPLWLRLRLRQKRQLFKPSSTGLLGQKRQLILNRKQGPVYVDNLFNEKMDLEKLEGVDVKLGLKKTEEVSGEEDHGGGNGADELWESLALASPLMHGIDDRAEHFIARFRADMEVQHILPPSL